MEWCCQISQLRTVGVIKKTMLLCMVYVYLADLLRENNLVVI